MWRGTVWGLRITQVVLGTILVLAAVLKAHQAATEPLPGEGLLRSRWFVGLWVEFEIALGLWLLSGLHPRVTWLLALVCFLAFSVVASYKIVRGDVSCGCFGKAAVSPWLTLGLDVGAVAALVLFCPQSASRPRKRPPYYRARLVLTALGVLAATVPAGWAMATYTPARLSGDARTTGDGLTVLLEPDTWVGRRCPLLDYIDIGEQVRHGRWILLLYHHDCPRCQGEVSRLDHDARGRAARAEAVRTAVVEMPPYGPSDAGPLPPDSPCVAGRVSSDRAWFVATPSIFALEEGIVVSVGEGGADKEKKLGLPGANSGGTPGIDNEPLALLVGDAYEAGFVEPGSERRFRLAVPNPSSQAACPREVRSECGCMTASADDRPVMPGEPFVVHVALAAPKEEMRYEKRIVLLTDAPDHGVIAIKVRADVGLPLEARPAVLDLGTLAWGETRRVHVEIANRGRRAVRLLYGTSSVPGCAVEVPADPVWPSSSVYVPLIIGAGSVGPHDASLQVATSAEGQPHLAVRVRFIVARVGEPPPVSMYRAGNLNP